MKKLALVLGAALSLGGSMAYAGHDDRMEKRTHRDSGYSDGNMARRTTQDYRLPDGQYRRDGSIFDRNGNIVGTYDRNMPRRTSKNYPLRDGQYRRDGSIFDRNGNIIGTYGDRRRAVPPGLAKKPGGMPPGQYKKLRDGYYR